jgi:hypothetical protein
LPRCSRPGHEESRVTLDGVYGTSGPKRQRFRCYPADGSTFHRFAGVMARQVVTEAVCAECDNAVRRHQGPVVAHSYDYPVGVVAAALLAVGKGETYAAAARHARPMTRRRPTARDDGGQLVANWVEVFADQIIGHYAERAWPETLLLDGTAFRVPEPVTGKQKLAFWVLAAYGYPAGARRGSLWALMASPQGAQGDWLRLLSAFDGAPTMVIADDAGAAAAGARLRWAGQDQPAITRCEWHLRDNALKLMGAYGLGPGSALQALLGSAFTSPAGWQAFKDKAAPYRHLAAWVARNNGVVTTQVARRHLLPAHHSLAAVEATLAHVGQRIERRVPLLRNEARTNLLLGLMRLDVNGLADERSYRSIIRRHLDAHQGKPAPQLEILDPRGLPSLRPRP